MNRGNLTLHWQAELMALLTDLGAEWASTNTLTATLNDRLTGPAPKAADVRKFLGKKFNTGEVERSGETPRVFLWRACAPTPVADLDAVLTRLLAEAGENWTDTNALLAAVAARRNGEEPNRTNFISVLGKRFTGGELERRGGGHKGSPYEYRLPQIGSQTPTPPPDDPTDFPFGHLAGGRPFDAPAGLPEAEPKARPKRTKAAPGNAPPSAPAVPPTVE